MTHPRSALSRNRRASSVRAPSDPAKPSLQGPAFLAFGILFLAALAPAQQAKPIAADLHDFKIVKPNFVVDGANLGKVEIWFWPTGTGITTPALIGTAARVTAPGKHEKWVLRIPQDLLAVEIFVTVSAKDGGVMGKKSLPYKGATDVFDALYGAR